jgi:hypothetical protein
MAETPETNKLDFRNGFPISTGARLERRLYEVQVGFKWFVEGLLAGRLGFGGEESAGSSFLRRDGSVWTTDKDGIVPCFCQQKLRRVWAKIRVRFIMSSPASWEIPSTNASMLPLRPNKKQLLQDCPRPTFTLPKLRSADPEDSDHRSGRRQSDWRNRSDCQGWLVCSTSFGHGENLQDLRREFPRSEPSTTDRGRSPDHCFGNAGSQCPGGLSR